MHGCILKLYFDRRNKFLRVDRGITFDLSKHIKPFISHNAKLLRLNKHDKYLNNFYKQNNNAPYDKNIKNVTKRSYTMPFSYD